MKKILSLLHAFSVLAAPFLIGFLGMRFIHDRVAFGAVVLLLFSFFSLQGMLEHLLTENNELKDKHEA